MKHWFLQVFIAFDQFINALIGGWADETLSSYSYRLWRDGKPWGQFWMPLIDGLFFWQRIRPDAIGHCHQAYLREKERYNFPPEMR